MSRRTPRLRCVTAAAALLACLLTVAAQGQGIDTSRGADPSVDYAALMRLGPWDDRNFDLTAEDLALLAPNEAEQRDAIPAFFRVELRKTVPALRREGPAQYPRSAQQIFFLRYGGYLIDGQLYTRAVRRDGLYRVLRENGTPQEDWAAKALAGDVRVTSPTGGAESSVEIHPSNANLVIAGSNGPGSGQVMHRSSNGGTSWSQAAALPLGGTCCDPTVDWSSDGTKAYAATLGGCGAVCNVWFYRSGDNGATWSDLGADPRREITSASISDKEFIHVDKFATSPFRDSIYVTWHDNNTMKLSRSTDLGQTFSAPLTVSSGSAELGIGSDIATDKGGNVYYFWPAFNSQRVLVKKSTNGGTSFGATVQVATTQASFIFPVPSMDTREVFVYTAADVDLTGGAFANRIYVAWTDSTAPTSGTPANNHARIQVAFSADGGATWSVRTPHETADAATVDRYHPWLSVGPDGTVYVAYYDTRVAGRSSVDFFYSRSTDGGNTWTAPARITTVTSPGIEDGFEWGDYNGLDVVGSQFISIFTDNRNEGGGTADSVDVYAAAPGGGGTVTVTFTSIGAEDGRITESTETSGVGGTINATATGAAALRIGDTATDQQLKSVLSFDTSSLPDTATVVAASVQVRRGNLTGTSPFTTHGTCRVDVQTGAFSGNNSLQAADFQAAATVVNAGALSNPASNGALSTATFSAAGRAAVNKTGRSQARIYCTLDDNDDLGADYVGFYSGENTTATNRPVLSVTYQP